MVGPDAGGRALRIMIANGIVFVAKILVWLMIIDAILTFIPSIDRRHPLVKLLRSITEPIYRPLRKVIPPVRLGDAGLDLTPLIAIIGIQLLASILAGIIAA